MKDHSCFVKPLQVSNAAQIIANANEFIIESFQFPTHASDNSKIVRFGSIQTSIVAETNANVDEQKEKIFRKVEKIVEAAAVEGVNVLCLPEMWYMPYPFYTPEDFALKDFAENDATGASSNLLKGLAAKFKMIIISSILEKESDIFFNTTLIVSTTGDVIGKYRKIHIPPIERPFLQPGAFEHPVFDTEFGKIGIVICYERHFPLCWMVHGLKEADIVFNPSAEDENSISERLWLAEGLNAAVSNGFFTVMVNRTGSEGFQHGKSIGYFGSNYVASPYGFATPRLSREKEGLLVTEIDLNVCRKVKEEFSFHQNKQLDLYINKLSEMKSNQS